MFVQCFQCASESLIRAHAGRGHDNTSSTLALEDTDCSSNADPEAANNTHAAVLPSYQALSQQSTLQINLWAHFHGI